MFYKLIIQETYLLYFIAMASVFAGVKQEIDVKAGLKDQSGKTIKVRGL